MDYYQILGIEDRNASMSDIKKQYLKLVVKYHPDKNPDQDPVIFEKIQKAWKCLGNEERRKKYDKICMVERDEEGSDFLALKKKYNKYQELNKTNVEDKDETIKNFKVKWDELNKKHGYTKNDKPISIEDTNNRYNDLLLERESNELEYTDNIIMDNKEFNIKKFNQIFDKIKEKETNKELILKDGPSAFNALVVATNYTDLSVYENPYDDNKFVGDNNFGNINFGEEIDIKISKEKIKNMSGVDYYENHNKKDESYMNELMQKIKERELETEKLKIKVSKIDEL